MNAFEARQAMGIEPKDATEESIFYMIDAVIRRCAQDGYPGVRFSADDWLEDVIKKYMIANHFLNIEVMWGLSDNAWSWEDVPIERSADDCVLDHIPNFHTGSGELFYPKGEYRERLAYRLVLLEGDKRYLTPVLGSQNGQ